MNLILVLHLLAHPENARADIGECAHVAGTVTNVCKNGSASAKSQADQLSNQYSKDVKGKGVKETADMMAKVTARIGQIYQAAQDACTASVASCQAACTGEGAPFATACQQEMAKPLTQLQGGHKETDHGNQVGTGDSKDAKSEIDQNAAGATSSSEFLGSTTTAGDSRAFGSAATSSGGGLQFADSTQTQPNNPTDADTGTLAGAGAGAGADTATASARQSPAERAEGKLAATDPSQILAQITASTQLRALRALRVGPDGRPLGGVRRPAGMSSAHFGEIGSAAGPTIFQIHSRAIAAMCIEARLKCPQPKGTN